MIDGNTTISLAFIVSITSISMTLINFKRNSRKIKEEGNIKLQKEIEEKVKMNLKLDQLCNTTNEIRTDNKSVLERLNVLDIRLTKAEQSVKSAHHRLDEHLKNHDEENIGG